MTPKNEHGDIRISPTAIAHVAKEAALQSYGVVGLTPRNFVDYLIAQFKRSHVEGVRVRVKGERITVDLYVIVQYGTRISEVAQGVMSQVKYALEQQLGIPVAEINVHVQSLRVNHEEES